MADATTQPENGKWGLSPSIRESIMSHQKDVGQKIKSGFRAILLACLICVVLLGANFALTVTAVVSNKDVYVSNDHGLVDGNGNHLEVDVKTNQLSVYDLPYQDLRTIARAEFLMVPDGTSTLVLYPSSFELLHEESSGHQLKMRTADGTSVLWGPPHSKKDELPVANRWIQLFKTNGEASTTFEEDARRLQNHKDHSHLSADFAGVNDFNYHGSISGQCNDYTRTRYWHTWGLHVSGFTPSPGSNYNAPYPGAMYLAGTSLSYDISVNGIVHGMVDLMITRGFAAMSMEYKNENYPTGCGGFTAKATKIGGCVDAVCDGVDYLDCASGLAVYGYSQGGQEALILSSYTSHRIGAVMSFSGLIENFGTNKRMQTECFHDHLLIDKHRRRAVAGAHDGIMGGDGETDHGHYGQGHESAVVANSLTISGYQATDCTTVYNCIQTAPPEAVGSGYYVVWDRETGFRYKNNIDKEGHFWFVAVDDSETQLIGLEPGFVSDTDHEWGAGKIFGWLSVKGKEVTSR